jgi:hypothetical protein
MRNLLFLGLFTVVATCSQAQEPTRVFEPYKPVPQPVDTPVTTIPGQIAVTTDPRIDATLTRYTELKHLQRGYRVQIFLGDRKTAEEHKRTFLQKYPDVPAYMSFLAPNFRLRVGDLRTRLEAERLLRDLKVLYPGSYIVPDEIEMPRLPDPPQ